MFIHSPVWFLSVQFLLYTSDCSYTVDIATSNTFHLNIYKLTGCPQSACACTFTHTQNENKEKHVGNSIDEFQRNLCFSTFRPNVKNKYEKFHGLNTLSICQMR